MADVRALFITLIISTALTDGYEYLRIEGLLPSFYDANYPPDDFIDDIDGPDLAGVNQPLSFELDVFGYTTDEVKIFDTGYMLLDPALDYLERTDDNFLFGGFPMIAPNWMESTLTGDSSYHVAWRLIDQTMAHRQHDFDRIDKEVNQAQEWYTKTWQSTHALVVTWKIGYLAGDFNKFQAVLATGFNQETSADEIYTLFIYEENYLPSQFGRVSATVNGLYDTDYKVADLCDPGTYPVHQYSNYKCATKGLYLFKMAAGSECTPSTDPECGKYTRHTHACTILTAVESTSIQNINNVSDSLRESNFNEMTAYFDPTDWKIIIWESTNHNCSRQMNYENPQCMVPFHQPQDTCKENVYCIMNTDETVATMTVKMKHYPFEDFSGLDFTAFIGMGSLEEPEGIQLFIGDCQSVLENAGSADALDTFEFDVNIDPVDAAPPCGVSVNTTENTIGYAFAIYDGNNPGVDLDGKLIFYGKCHFRDLARHVSVTNMFNDIEVTEVARRVRSLTLKWIDRPDPANGLEILTGKTGRDVYSSLCFNPGIPFEREVDPFGVKVEYCIISNNPQFINYDDAQTGDERNRAIRVFNAGCVSRTSEQSFYFTEEFHVHPSFDVIGGEWCLITGKMDLTAFNSADKKIWMQCRSRFCYSTSDTTCHNNCAGSGGGRGTRSVRVNTTGTRAETIVVSIDIEQEEEPAPQPVTDNTNDNEDCVSQITAIVTIVILIVITIIALAAAIAIFILLQKRNRIRRKM